MIQEILNRILGRGDASRMKRGWRCPDETALAAFMDAQMSGQARQRVLAHLADCRACCDQVAAAVRVQSGNVPSDVPLELLARARALADRKESGHSMPVLRWGAVAAAASMALVVAVTYRRPDAPATLPVVQPTPIPTVTSAPPAPPPVATEPPSVRNLQRAASAPQVLYPRDGGVVSSTGAEFRWKRVPTALSYDVRVVTEDGDLVWEGSAEESRIILPATVHLAAGEAFYVRVRANLPEGKSATSKAVGFKVKKSS